MKDIQFIAGILLGLCIIASQKQDVDAAFTMNETCRYVDSGYIGDPTNCQGWGYCEGGSLKTTGKCNPGFLYDTQQGICNYNNLVDCRTTTDNICLNVNQPQFIPDPNNCNRYCYCNNKVAECTSCPLGQVYNPSENTCVWGKDYVCPADSICRLVPNNKFVGDPAICGNYIRCVDGAGVSSSKCSPGYAFNPMLGSCDPNFGCSDGGTGAGTSKGLPPNTDVCKTQYSASGAKKQFFSDAVTCFGYYACTSTSGPGQWGKCPYGTQFDSQKQVCATPYAVVCRKDRCGNLDLPFVADPGCETYSVCRGQTTTTANQSCAAVNSAFPYFDEFGGGCVAVKPDQAICAATPNPPPAAPKT